ncbi:uncharacterized protein LOC127756264 [Oryza glaberrima]|uniref:uncharacterized protein LOC127756264 n=1 Tax=Oryza glaberrima TaxID=4538 RepID=UPI00224C4BDE|nr:uncharacterized protein LOC127756264 [Oryza glaberrima]
MPPAVEMTAVAITIPRERRARRRCSGARIGRRRRVLVVVPAEPNHPKSNSCATRIASTSSSKALKNPSQCRNDEGDRRLLPQVQPPTTVVDSLIPARSPDGGCHRCHADFRRRGDILCIIVTIQAYPYLVRDSGQDIPEDVVPSIGMTFESKDAAYSFYNRYARKAENKVEENSDDG